MGALHSKNGVCMCQSSAVLPGLKPLHGALCDGWQHNLTRKNYCLRVCSLFPLYLENPWIEQKASQPSSSPLHLQSGHSDWLKCIIYSNNDVALELRSLRYSCATISGWCYPGDRPFKMAWKSGDAFSTRFTAFYVSRILTFLLRFFQGRYYNRNVYNYYIWNNLAELPSK